MELANEVLNDLVLIISQPLRDVLPVYLLVLEVRHIIIMMCCLYIYLYWRSGT